MPGQANLWAAVPSISNVHGSGDGEWAFWCLSGLAETDSLWCAPSDGSSKAQQLTDGSDHYQIRDVNFDGSKLILAQSRFASDQDQLWLLDRNRGELKPLTPAQDRHYL